MIHKTLQGSYIKCMSSTTCLKTSIEDSSNSVT